MSEIIDMVEVAIPGPAGDASPEMIAAAETRAGIIVNSMDLPGQASQDVADAVAAANIPGLVQSEVNNADIPGQVEDAIASSETVRDAVNAGINNADIPQLAQDAVSSAGGGLLAAQRAQVYATNHVPNPMGLGISEGGPAAGSRGAGVSLTPPQMVSVITTGLPPGFGWGVACENVSPSGSLIPLIAEWGVPGDGPEYRIPVNPGEVFSVGAFAFIESGGGVTSAAARARVQFYRSDLTLIGVGGETAPTSLSFNTWEFRKSQNIITPPDAAYVAIQIIISILGPETSQGVKTRVTGFIKSNKSAISPDDYGDGTRRLWNFTGVAHKSPSVRVFRTDAEEGVIDGLIYGDSDTGLPLLVSVDGTEVTIRQVVGDKPLETQVDLEGSANLGFTLSSITWGGVTASFPTDDITPIRTQMGTVGANHGFRTVAAFTNPDSKTAADVGSVWSDGSREYVIFDILSDGRIVVGGDYTGGAEVPILSAYVDPVANLTHVSGATNTAPIDYTTRAPRQLTPGTTQRHRTAIILDGSPLSSDGVFAGAALTIHESYAIVDYASLYDMAKANVGVPITQLGAKSAVQVQNVWEWRAGGVLQIQHALDELSPTTLMPCGAVQSAALQVSGAELYRYVPGMGAAGGRDWSAGVNMTSYSSTAYLTEGMMISDREVPAFHIDVLEASGSPYLGFAMGYLPNRKTSDARGEARIENAPTRLWDMRDTKKVYPAWTTGEAAGWGHREVSAYRVHLAPAQIQRVLAMPKSATESVAALLAESGLPID